MIQKRLKTKKTKIGDLFTKLGISEKENVQFIPTFHLKVKTPYGYKDIKNLFRTEKQQSVRCYFGNNKTIEVGLDHLFKVNGDWKKVKDINIDNDIIETETGVTYLKKIHYGKEKILYDISVEDVNCYYSNEVLSHNSWMLVAIANHAVVKLKKNVIYYTLELSGDYVGLRNDANLTGFSSQDIAMHQAEVISELGKVQGNLIIKHYPMKNATVSTLRAHIIRCINFGFKPDMVILDYPDLLRGTVMWAKAELRHELENIYMEIRGLAGEFDLPIWGASQANRASLDDEIIEAGKIAESYNKIMIADFVISLQRKTKDKLAHTGRIHVIKNRFGPDGFTFPSKMNASNGHIEMFDDNKDEGRKIRKSTEEGGILERKQLGKKVKELMNKDNDEINFGLG